jgi:hypothetical protein
MPLLFFSVKKEIFLFTNGSLIVHILLYSLVFFILSPLIVSLLHSSH